MEIREHPKGSADDVPQPKAADDQNTPPRREQGNKVMANRRPKVKRISTYALNDALADFHPQSTAELIGGLRQRLEALDDHAQSLLDAGVAAQRGEVVRLAIPTFTLPPGAAQCPQAEYQRYGSMDSISSGSVFTSSVSNQGLASGRYMYEAILGSMGSMRIGFCGPINMFLWDHKSGVGSFPFTVGYDGSECKLWNVESSHAGWKWAPGDTITVTFDLDIGEVTYYQNGKRVVSCNLPTVRSLMAAGIAHSDRDVQMCYFPAVSLAPWQECHVNCGGFPFSFPQEGFRPIDPSFECLYASWIPRLGTLDMIPPHLERHRHTIAAIILERLTEDTEARFMDFAACIWEFLWVLHCHAKPRALRMLEVLRQGCGDDMFLDLAAAFISCSCAYSQCAWVSAEGDLCGTFGIPFDGIGPDPYAPIPANPNPCLLFAEWIIDDIPESIHRWARLFSVTSDLMLLADLKMPNERDLEDLFPEIGEEDVLSPTLSRKLYAAQERVANSNLKPDEAVRQRIFCKLLADPGFRAQVTVSLQTLVSEIKEVAKDPSKRVSHRTYSERMVGRLFFHVIFAVAMPNSACDAKTAAELLCPLSVLKMPSENPNFSGVPHEQLLTFGGCPDFSNVPTLGPSSPECLMYTACELYTLVVKGWMVGAFNEIVSNHVARKRYAVAAQNAVTPAAKKEVAAMREGLIKTTRNLSWTMSSLFLAGFHRDLIAFASLVFKMTNHYADTPYAKFIPVMFVECATDLVHFCRKTCPNYSILIKIRPEVPIFFMQHFRSPIIHHQPTREYILMTVGGLVDMHEEHRRQVAKVIRANVPVLRRFFAQVIDQFSNTMAWTLVVGMIFRFNSGNGFCMTEVDDSIQWTTVFQERDPIPAESYTAYKELDKIVLDFFNSKEAWADEVPDCSPLSFFKSAVTHSNWCITELSAVLAGTDPSEPFSREVRARRQRGASIFDYTVKILHILEYLTSIGYFFYFETSDNNAGTVPAHNAPPISAASKALLVVELVGQCLARFGSPESSLRRVAGYHLQGYESYIPEKVLAPVVGLLLNMMGPKNKEMIGLTCHLTTAEAMRMWRERRGPLSSSSASSSAASSSPSPNGGNGIPPTVEAFITQLVSTNVFFKQMAQARVDWSHAAVSYVLTGVDWPAVCRRAHSNSHLLKGLPLAGMAYEALMEAREANIAQFNALRNAKLITSPATHIASDGSPSPAGDVDGTGADDEALCAICCVAPLEVAFEPCGHSSCLPCIERHQISDRRCFFCKAEVTRTKAIAEEPTTEPASSAIQT